MKIALVDDEQAEAARLSECISCYTDKNTQIDVFQSGEEFLGQWDGDTYDLIILDIFMGGMLGIDVAKQIREKNQDVCLVFCTSSNDFASESYEVDARFYLRKPFSEEKVKAMLDRLDLEALERSRSVSLPDGQRLILQNILYTEYFGHNIAIHLKNGTVVSARMTQAQAEALLCEYPFFYCCFKGVIVNFYEVVSQKADAFVMRDAHAVPISRRKAKEISDAYADFRFQQMRKGGEN